MRALKLAALDKKTNHPKKRGLFGLFFRRTVAGNRAPKGFQQTSFCENMLRMENQLGGVKNVSPGGADPRVARKIRDLEAQVKRLSDEVSTLRQNWEDMIGLVRAFGSQSELDRFNRTSKIDSDQTNKTNQEESKSTHETDQSFD